jgi:hypothetical protein
VIPGWMSMRRWTFSYLRRRSLVRFAVRQEATIRIE